MKSRKDREKLHLSITIHICCIDIFTSSPQFSHTVLFGSVPYSQLPTTPVAPPGQLEMQLSSCQLSAQVLFQVVPVNQQQVTSTLSLPKLKPGSSELSSHKASLWAPVLFPACLAQF